jgi:hypothetical protein
MCWLHPDEKRPFMRSRNLSFVDEEGRCRRATGGVYY